MLKTRISGLKDCLHMDSDRLDFKLCFVPEFQLNLGSRPFDAPHVGLVCPYNSKAGGSGYEVLKYFMMAMPSII